MAVAVMRKEQHEGMIRNKRCCWGCGMHAAAPVLLVLVLILSDGVGAVREGARGGVHGVMHVCSEWGDL